MAKRRELSTRSLAVHRPGRRRRIGIGIMAVSLALIGTLFAPFTPGTLVLLGLAAFFGVPIGAIVATTARRDPGDVDGRPGSLRFEGRRLTAEYGQVKYELTADELDHGWIEEAQGGPSLVLRTKQGDLVAARLDEPDRRVTAQALLDDLELDGSAVHLTIGSAPTAGRGCATGCLYAAAVFGLPLLVGLIGLAIQVIRGDQVFVFGLVMALIATAVVATGAFFSLRALRSAEVTIGSDGLWIKRTPWRKRYIPYGAVRAAHQQGEVARIETESDQLSIPCQDVGVVNDLVRRVEAARSQWQEAARAADLTELDRGGRPPGRWREQLLALFEQATAYRARALQRDDLWQVVEDPKANPERRVGAALALSKRAKTQERRRLRIAAASCALRPLRIAIEEAAEGELEAEALEEAMEAHRSTTG